MPKNTKQHHIIVKKRYDKLKKSLSHTNLQTTSTLTKKYRDFIYKNSAIEIKDFAKETQIPVNNILGYFFKNKQVYTIKSSIIKDEIIKLCENFNIKFIEKSNSLNTKDTGDLDELESLYFYSIEKEHIQDIHQRPPIITVMGHVDHGKTTLLDNIRKTNIIAGEAGGITQHIGASLVEYKGQKITFIDTPGHELFTEMRSLGADLTDIILLVVAADDGIKEQTIEAIDHAKAANKQLIVVITKIDLPSAKPEFILQQLAQHGIIVEPLGGDVLSVNVSAKKGINIDLLLENILLQSEILRLTADFNAVPTGVVFESNLDKNFGASASLLVQNGILKVNDHLAINDVYGKAKLLKNQFGETLTECYPSHAVQVFGFEKVPSPLGKFIVFPTEQDSRKYNEEYTGIKKSGNKSKTFLFFRGLSNQILENKVNDLNIVLKADVSGSLAAIKLGISKLNLDKGTIKIVHQGTGALTKNDLTLAIVTKSLVISFNSPISSNLRSFAKENAIIIKEYKIIYKLIEEISAWVNKTKPETEQFKLTAKAKVRNVFDLKGIGQIAGCIVLEGIVERSNKIILYRDKKKIHEGWIKSLKHLKENVNSVKTGVECGILLKDFNGIKIGDELHFFTKENNQN